MKNVIVFNNNGKTFDRYTILNKKNGDVYGASDNPFHPQGFGQFSGNVADRMNITFGYGWRKGHTPKGIKRIVKSEIDNYINEAKKDVKWLGKEIEVKSLPQEVQQYIKQVLA